jgi:hypothetical protein
MSDRASVASTPRGDLGRHERQCAQRRAGARDEVSNPVVPAPGSSGTLRRRRRKMLLGFVTMKDRSS